MGLRRLALLLLLAACPKAKPASDVTTPETPAGSAAGSAVTDGSAASQEPAGSAAPLPPSTPVSNATLAEAGVEATSLDRSVDPCVDFYQFACGGWLAANKIPDDRSAWSRLSEMHETTQAQLQALLDEAAKKPGDKLGDYYASCMDEPAIEKAGTSGIKALLAKAQGVKDARTWFSALGELHKAGIWVVWAASGDAGLSDATKNVTWLDSAGLGLPDRDYYDKPAFTMQLASYKEHVGRMLALAGVAKPGEAAADVLAIESALAKVTKTGVERQDVKKLNNLFDLKGLAKQTTSIDWKAYFKTLGVTPSAKILVTSPAFFAAIDNVRKDYKPAQWASYFTYHLLVRTAFALPRAFDDEAFALQRVLSGAPEKLPRTKRCIESTAAALGELLGKLYVEKHFPASTKQIAQTMFEAMTKAMGEELGKVEWMTAPTRATAQAKLAKLVGMIGYPDKWRTYDVAIKRSDFAGNLLRARTFETKRSLAKAGKPQDRGEWFANTFDVSAYYSSSAHNMALLAGILQAPFFGAGRSVAANMGGIGHVIGHELTHAFDNIGAEFDAAGNLADWWTKEDKAAFEERGTCVAQQYSTFEVLPKQFINGELTLAENIADMGGMKMAYKAYKLLRKDEPMPMIADGFTEDQIFFLAGAQIQCAKMRPAEMQRYLATNTHSPPKFRVYGELRNLPEFASAFSCAAGTPMRPAQTCTVW